MQNVDFADSQTPNRHHAPPHRYLHNVPHQQLYPQASHHQNQFSIYAYWSTFKVPYHSKYCIIQSTVSFKVPYHSKYRITWYFECQPAMQNQYLLYSTCYIILSIDISLLLNILVKCSLLLFCLYSTRMLCSSYTRVRRKDLSLNKIKNTNFENMYHLCFKLLI